MGCNFTLEIEGESLDLLGEMSAIGGYEQILAETDVMEIDEANVRVLSLKQLIATKEAAGRPKDMAVLPVLKATLDLQQGN